MTWSSSHGGRPRFGTDSPRPRQIRAPLFDPPDRATYRWRMTAKLDGTAVLVLLRLITSAEGATVRTASSGREALDLLREWKPDVVLLDIEMPVMNGYRASLGHPAPCWPSRRLGRSGHSTRLRVRQGSGVRGGVRCAHYQTL